MQESQVISNENLFRLFGGIALWVRLFLLYRWVLEDEIASWRGFRKALPSDEDREAFDELMDFCRFFAPESSNATKPIIFEPMVISILLGQQRRIRELGQKLIAMQPT